MDKYKLQEVLNGSYICRRKWTDNISPFFSLVIDMKHRLSISLHECCLTHWVPWVVCILLKIPDLQFLVYQLLGLGLDHSGILQYSCNMQSCSSNTNSAYSQKWWHPIASSTLGEIWYIYELMINQDSRSTFHLVEALRAKGDSYKIKGKRIKNMRKNAACG